MAFVKLDKPTDEWVNLDHVVRVDISGNGKDQTVRVWLDLGGVLVPETIASGLSPAEAVLEAQKIVEDAPRKPQAQKPRGR